MAELETIEHRVEAGNSIVELKRRGEAYEVWVDGKRRLATDSHGGELLEFVEKPRTAGMPPEGFMAIVLDTDDAVGELWHPDNAALYTEDGLLRLERALRAGGVLATKVSGRDLELQARLVGLFQNVAEVCIPVELPDTMQLHYVYRGRRPPNTDPNKPKN